MTSLPNYLIYFILKFVKADTLKVNDYIISFNGRNVRNVKGPDLMQDMEQCNDDIVICTTRIILNPSDLDSPLPKPKRKVGNPIHVTISMEGEEERTLHARTIDPPIIINNGSHVEDLQDTADITKDLNNDIQNGTTGNVKIHIMGESVNQNEEDEIEEMEGGEGEELHSVPDESDQFQVSEPQVTVEINLVNDDKGNYIFHTIKELHFFCKI